MKLTSYELIAGSDAFCAATRSLAAPCAQEQCLSDEGGFAG